MKASVIIATKNRAARLSETLGYLQQQACAFDWEILVADNGSTDRTPQVVEEWGARLPVRRLSQPVAGKNRALNVALPEARGELLVFTDDDVVLEPTWLAEIVRAADAWPSYDIFCGPILPIWPEATPAWIKDHPFAAIAFAKFTPNAGEGPLDDEPFGPNFAVRATTMAGKRFTESIGAASGNDALYPLGDETELFLRLKQAGSRTIFIPRAPVGHYVESHQLDSGWLLRRSFRSGRGYVVIRPDTTSARALGAPRYLWRMLAASGARYLLSLMKTEQQRFERRLRFHHLRGILYEYRHGV